MNKLRENLEQVLINNSGLDSAVNGCERISDDFAVKLVEWFVLNIYESEVGFYNSTELLQIFKTNHYE